MSSVVAMCISMGLHENGNISVHSVLSAKQFGTENQASIPYIKIWLDKGLVEDFKMFSGRNLFSLKSSPIIFDFFLFKHNQVVSEI